MQRFSHILKQRLAAAPMPERHPSADQLTAFAERALPGAERETVLTHLAFCSHCRDTVALAAPEVLADSLPPRSATLRAFPMPWRWASAAAALAIALGVGAIVELQHPAATQQVAQQIPNGAPLAQPQPSSPNVTPNAPVTKDIAESKRQPAIHNEPRANALRADSPAKARPVTQSAAKVANVDAAVNASAAPAPPAQYGATGGSVNSVSVNGNANDTETRSYALNARAEPSVAKAQQAPAADAFGGTLMKKPARAVALNAAASYHGALVQWSVSDAGQLQRRANDGTVQVVEPANGALFRKVAASGIEVWAAGAEQTSAGPSGALFHSSDAGETWTRVSGPWTSPLTSVVVNGVNAGAVTVTSADRSWTSTDSGRSWTEVRQ